MSTGRLGAGDTAIQPTLLDAKGDLVTATAADTPARLAVGNNGETLVADSGTATGLRWQGNYAAGKNKIINGDFAINQRQFTSATTSGTFTFDRWFIRTGGDGTGTFSAQTFTLGAAPVAGYEGANYIRVVTAGSTNASTLMGLRQNIESVRTFAGQTITLSFWARATSGTPKVWMSAVQNFGTGGSPSASVDNAANSTVTLSTSWTRYSVNIVMPSISGKTIGTNNNDLVLIQMIVSAGTDFAAANTAIGIQNNTFEFWGVQLEAGSVATPFTTATGTLQGELAACQRYYWRTTADGSNTYLPVGQGISNSATDAMFYIKLPQRMRVKPSTIGQANLCISDLVNYNLALTSIAWTQSSEDMIQVQGISGTGATQYRPAFLRANNSSTAYLEVSAEL